jgi:hypothetical protein
VDQGAMSTLKENLKQAADLFGMLWYHGSFPLSFVTYTAVAWFIIGVTVGRLAS